MDSSSTEQTGSTVNRPPKLSVVIPCYNYGRFLRAAVDSVLNEDVGAEVIVVDDCSSDDSRDIMRSYGDRIVPVFQTHNQGHGGAFNAGWAKATGDLICFLDADDFIVPGQLKQALGRYEPGVLLYHFRLRYADETGALSGYHPPLEAPLGEGDLSRQLREQGRYASNVSSGLIFSRDALQRVMPVDAESYRMSAEGYLVSVIPMYGPTRSFDDVLAAYRLHTAQNWGFQQDLSVGARKRLRHDFDRYKAIRDHAVKLGLPVANDLGDSDLWHLNDRLVSLTFEPAQHPVPGDTIAKVVKLANAVRVETESPKALYSRLIWWTVLGLSPSGVRSRLLRWRMDPRSRPKWLASTGRFLRRRLGIVPG